MSGHTSFRVGGPADAMLSACADEILRALTPLREAGIPVTVIGNGTNLVVRDGGSGALSSRSARG